MAEAVARLRGRWGGADTPAAALAPAEAPPDGAATREPANRVAPPPPPAAVPPVPPDDGAEAPPLAAAVSVNGTLDAVASCAVSLAFLVDFYDTCVAPLEASGRPPLTTKQVVTDVIMPATEHAGGRNFAALVPRAVGRPTAFASHAFGNLFSLLVAALRAHFAAALASEVYVWIDVFAINQQNPGQDLHKGRTLARTIELAAHTLVVLDRGAVPMSRLWCLFEIGTTPPHKLLLLTPGFSEADVAATFRGVNVAAAQCFDGGDTAMIRERIVVKHTSLDAFQRLLRLLLLLKPTSYEADCAALRQRSEGEAWRFEELFAFAEGGSADDDGAPRLACIAGGPGEGKSTLAAALCHHSAEGGEHALPAVHAHHFCKASDVRRQDVGEVIRSLSYQLALRFPPFAAAVLALSVVEAQSLWDPAKAWELLLAAPLRALPRATRVLLLLDALDEAGDSSGVAADSSGISKVLSMLLDLGRLQGGAALSVIVTTRPERAIMAALRGCWRGSSARQEMTPASLRGSSADEEEECKLLGLLRSLLPPGAAAADSVDGAYTALFDAAAAAAGGQAGDVRRLLSILVAARTPPSLAQLEALRVRAARTALPGWGVLFQEREHCVHTLHRSLGEWLRDGDRAGVFAADAGAGHAIWAEHLSQQLREWLQPTAGESADVRAAAPAKGSYVYAHVLPHLDAAGRGGEARALLLRLPWLQATLRERGLYALLSDVSSRMASAGGTLRLLFRALRLAAPGLQGSDAAEALPAQLVGRLCALPAAASDPDISRLCEEAHAWTGSRAWLHPLRATLRQPIGALQMQLEGHSGGVLALLALPDDDGHMVSASADFTARLARLHRRGGAHAERPHGLCVRAGGAGGWARRVWLV
jgi:hypothetical protein